MDSNPTPEFMDLFALKMDASYPKDEDPIHAKELWDIAMAHADKARVAALNGLQAELNAARREINHPSTGCDACDEARLNR